MLKIDNELLDRLFNQFSEFARRRESLRPEEMKSLFSATLAAGLARMNLVTREEFEAQTALLARTRAKLDQLEAQIATMEKEQP